MSNNWTPMQLQIIRNAKAKLERRTQDGESNLRIKYIHGIPKIVSSLNWLRHRNSFILSIYGQNGRTLRSKTHSFFNNVSDLSYDIILIVHTWLDDTISDSELFPGFYNVARCNRNLMYTRRTRGGSVNLSWSQKMSIQLDASNLSILVSSEWVCKICSSLIDF